MRTIMKSMRMCCCCCSMPMYQNERAEQSLKSKTVNEFIKHEKISIYSSIAFRIAS